MSAVDDLNINVPQSEELKAEVVGLTAQVQQYSVTTNEQYETAGNELVRINSMKKKVDETFDPVIEQAHKAHKSILAVKKTFADPLENAITTLKKAMLVFKQEQDRKAREEQERQRKLAEEEAKRQQEELEAQALEAIDNGNEEEAQELIDQTQTVIPIVPIVVPQVQKIAGVGTRKTWKAEVVDQSKVPAYWNGIEVRVINQSKLNEIARTFNGTAQIPGVKFYEEESISASKRAI